MVQWVLGMDAYVCVYIYISRSHWIVLCHHPFFFLLFYDLTCSAEALSTAGLSYWVLSSSERNSASPCLHGFLLLSLKRITNIFFPLHDTYNTYVVLTGLFLLCIFKDSYSKAWGKKKSTIFVLISTLLNNFKFPRVGNIQIKWKYMVYLHYRTSS